MGTIRDAEWADEDDADDADFVADVPELHRRSSSPSSDGDDAARPPKRARLDTGRSDDPVLADGPTQDVEDVWATFHDPPASRTTSDASFEPAPSARRKITIRRRYTFAGEEHEEDVDVWDDSQEALDYAQRLRDRPPPVPSPSIPSAPAPRVDAPIERGTAHFGQGYERRQEGPATAAKGAAGRGTTSARPGPKRGKSSLAAMAASLGAGGKAVKLSTLEKSKLDWNKYVAQNNIAEDLAKGRKDGYTERQAFLERTEDRFDSAMAKHRGGSRAL